MSVSREEIRDTLFELLEREASEADFQRFAGAHTSVDWPELENQIDGMDSMDAIYQLAYEITCIDKRQKGRIDG